MKRFLESICDSDDPFVFYLDDVNDNVTEVELIVHANVRILLIIVIQKNNNKPSYLAGVNK